MHRPIEIIRDLSLHPIYAHTSDPQYQLVFPAAVRKLLPSLGVSGACKVHVHWSGV